MPQVASTLMGNPQLVGCHANKVAPNRASNDQGAYQATSMCNKYQYSGIPNDHHASGDTTGSCTANASTKMT